jgi:hypothetical protein
MEWFGWPSLAFSQVSWILNVAKSRKSYRGGPKVLDDGVHTPGVCRCQTLVTRFSAERLRMIKFYTCMALANSAIEQRCMEDCL